MQRPGAFARTLLARECGILWHELASAGSADPAPRRPGVSERPRRSCQVSRKSFSVLHGQTRAQRAPKTVRPTLVRLHVSGDVCPNLLPRLLGLVAQFDQIPYGIALTRFPAGLKLSIDLGRLEEARAEILLNKVSGIPTVRGARLVAVRRN